MKHFRFATVLLSTLVVAASASAEDTSPGAEKPKADAAIHAKEAAGAPAESEDRLISLVVLVKEPRKLDQQSVSALVSKAVGIAPGNDTKDDTFVVAKPPYYRVKLNSGFYVINNIDKPYFDEMDKLAAEIDDPALRKAVSDHHAWVSVDWAGKEEPEDLKAAYSDIGKIAAALAAPDGVAVYSPETGQLSVFNAEAGATLAGGDPIKLFVKGDGETVSISDDDPELQAAAAEARKGWTEFKRAFEAKEGKNFAVKGRIAEGDEAEYMWLAVTKIDADQVHGTLDNSPVVLKALKPDQDLHIKLSEVDDWIYVDSSGKQVGGFTLNRRQMAAAKR